MAKEDWEDLWLYLFLHFNEIWGKSTLRTLFWPLFLYPCMWKLITGCQQYLSWTDIKQQYGEGLVMTQLGSPDAAGWWQLTSSRWRAVHERERQPELIRSDFTSAPLSCLHSDLAHCWALLCSQSWRLSQVQLGCLYPSSILAFSPFLSSTIKIHLFLKSHNKKSSYLGTDFFCWHLHTSGIKKSGKIAWTNKTNDS